MDSRISRISKHCIFCGTAMSESQTGKGEHVIPQNIYGFWRIKDVCDECMTYFGNTIDGLGIKNAEIINAMNILGLPDLNKYLDNLPYEGADTATGDIKRMIKRGDQFRVKVQDIDKTFFECDEEAFHSIGVDWIRRIAPSDISEQQREDEIQRLRLGYDKLLPISEIESELLGVIIRKAQVHNVKIGNQGGGAITPLIAKIAVCYLFYRLGGRLSSVIELSQLIRHARYNDSIKPFIGASKGPGSHCRCHSIYKFDITKSSRLLKNGLSI